jgi:putative inorganic carbon (HCO3(-)) transporter
MLLMLMVLVSLYATYSIEFSLPKIAGIVLGVGFFFAFVHLVKSENGIQWTLLLFILTGFVISGVGLLGLQQFQKIGFLQPLIVRLPVALTNLPGAEGGFHPNEVAGAILWFFPLMIALSWWLLGKRKRILQSVNEGKYFIILLTSILILLFVFIVFLLAQSRSAFLALLITFCLFLIISLPSKWRLAGGFVLILLTSLLGWYSWQQGWIQRLYEVTTSGGTTASVVTLNGRVEIWSRALYAIQDFPFTGMGMNTFRKIMPILYPLFTVAPEVDIGHAHNEFLQAALDLGIPGLIAFMAIYFVAFSMLLQTWQQSGRHHFTRSARGLDLVLLSSSGIKALVTGISASLLAHALYGLTDAVALGAKPGILFWMLLGLAAGLHALVCGGVIIKRQTIKNEP